MINEINYLKNIKDKLLSTFVIILVIVFIPKLTVQYLKFFDLTINKIILISETLITVLLVLKLLKDLRIKINYCKKIENLNLIVKINLWLSQILLNILVFCIFSLLWTSFIQLLTFFDFNVSIGFVTLISQLCMWAINTFSFWTELLFILVYIYDFVIVSLRHKIFL